MKMLSSMTALGIGLLALVAPASAQYGGYYEPREYRERGYSDRDYRYRDRGYDEYQERPRYRERRVVFDEDEYLRCNRDVRRAVMRGEFESGLEHFQRHGRREARRLTC